MKKPLDIFRAWALIFIMTLTLTACGGNKTLTKPPEETPKQTVNENTLSADAIIGSYEGEWQMSPNMKPLASLVLLKNNRYEFYISIMGLTEEGSFEVSGEDKITFKPETADASITEGKYAGGIVTASFKLDKEPVPFTLTQVGSPDDVYKSFLGDYVTKVMGSMDVTLSLLPGRKYENTQSKETGTFKLSNGTITLIPDKQGASPITGSFNIGTKEMKVHMSVVEGTPAAELTFKIKSEEKEVAGVIYKGTSTVGMTGSTAVTLVFKDEEKFELQTTKPRGTGIYKISEEGDKLVITLTYTEPAKRPDGSEFKMTGTIKNKDIKAPGNSITINLIEYIVNMGGSDSIMDLGQVTFELSTGN